MTMPDWSAAAAAAAALVAPWAEGGAPGGAILAFDANAMPVEQAAGLESLSTGAGFSADSVVRYASVTKHVLAAMQRRHAGAVGLDAPLGRHLLELRGPMADVTVARALDMTGGLPDVRESLALLGLSVHTATEPGPILDFLAADGALNFAPGTEISYSNTGYRLVEAALARQGHLFADFAGSLGFGWQAPETWFDPVPGLVPGYWRNARGWQLGTAGLHLSASGSLTGSARALARWGQAILADSGPAAGLLAAQAAPRFLADGRPTAYGLGLAKGRLGGLALVGHGGSHAGYKTYLLLAPDAGLGVVLVANREDVASYTLALRVMAALCGQPLPPAATLPGGLYAEPGTGHWLDVSNNTASFLGAGESLYQDNGWAVSLSAHNPMRLRATADGIEGEVGHVARRFTPVAPGAVDDALSGPWVQRRHHAAFTISGDKLAMGTGPARGQATLRRLGEGVLLATAEDGPWAKQFSLRFAGDRVRLCSHRSRVLEFARG